MPQLTIATRGSQLALAQAEWVAARLRELDPGLTVDLKVLKTKGDKILDVPLAKVGGKGLFVKEIEDALLTGQAQVAVHSMKDMPTELPPGLVIAAITQREDPRDVLVTRDGRGVDGLPANPRIGTSSLRRQAQALALRPDAEIVSIRGNVQTRLKKMEELGLDAILLASAGLRRLEMADVPVSPLEPTQMLPAVGQGALAIEINQADQYTMDLCTRLDHQKTAWAVAAERAFLARLEGGCQVPIAGYAVVEDGQVIFEGLVASLDGKQVIRSKKTGSPDAAAQLGRQAAEEVLDAGGREILASVYGEGPK